MPQFADRWNLVKNYRNIATGLFIFVIGLFKKVVIADTFAVWATNGFDKAEVLNLVEAWATSLSYTFQLYFDFSGYTDMAIGTALLFNIKLPQNFNSPYKAKDIQDFWKRWHITLSRFLRDYIYIPLGGNRVPEYRIFSNLMITFLIGGLWHGAGWTFIFWGFLHGGALIIHKIWKYTGFKLNSMLAWFITFNFINITWVFFRAREWSDALKVLSGMFGFSGIMLPKSMSFLNYESVIITENWLSNIYADYYIIVYILITILALLTLPNSNELKNKLTFNYLSVIFLIIIMVVSFLNLGGVHEFLYFNF
jgi:D-alanyl-lipoteichoic acid acyltransferase DltB (MBOAT superfamily)